MCKVTRVPGVSSIKQDRRLFASAPVAISFLASLIAICTAIIHLTTKERLVIVGGDGSREKIRTVRYSHDICIITRRISRLSENAHVTRYTESEVESRRTGRLVGRSGKGFLLETNRGHFRISEYRDPRESHCEK